MQKILITGAGGFIGKVAVSTLVARGWQVKAMMRRPRASSVDVVLADMQDEFSLRAALDSVDVVVHLAAAKADEPDSDSVNVEGARRLVAACQEVGCRRIINISTQSAKLPRKGVYGRTKYEADRVFHASDLQVTTLYPSVVYGEELSGVFGAIVHAVRRLPIVPILGTGEWESAPVYVGDLAEAIALCIERNGTIGKRYDIGGPDLVRFDTLIESIASVVGVRRAIFRIPFPMALFGVRWLKRIWPAAPITVSNVLGSNQTAPFDMGPAQRDLGFQPVGLVAGLQRVIHGSAEEGERAESNGEDEALAAESRMFAKYLLGVDLPRELQERYLQACRKLIGMPPGPETLFARCHPWAIPCLDGAIGLLCPGSDLRRRVFVMAAVLEATPRYAEFYLSVPRSAGRIWAELMVQGLRYGINIFVGIPLYLWVRCRS